VVLSIIVRLAIMVEIVPIQRGLPREFHHWNTWANEIDSLAGGRPVVFVNTFQMPSKYRFYSGNVGHSLNDIRYRKNQYDLWKIEESLQDSSVLLMQTPYPEDSIITSTGHVYRYRYINRFTSYYNLVINPSHAERSVPRNTNIKLNIEIYNPREVPVNFADDQQQTKIVATFFTNNVLESKQTVLKGLVDTIPSNNSIAKSITVKTPEHAGEYSMYLSLRTQYLYLPFNSKPLNIKVQ
jgi:hypothetical protein